MAFDPAIVSVALKSRNTRSMSALDYKTQRYICDEYQYIYKHSLGHREVALKDIQDMSLHFFFCPLQLVKNKGKYRNEKNPTVSSFLNLGVHWYGSILVLASVNRGVVDIDESNEFRMIVEQSVHEWVHQYSHIGALVLMLLQQVC